MSINHLEEPLAVTNAELEECRGHDRRLPLHLVEVLVLTDDGPEAEVKVGYVDEDVVFFEIADLRCHGEEAAAAR